MGASEAVMEASYLAGVFLAGWLAPAAGPRMTFRVSGLGFVAAGLVSAAVIGRVRRRRPAPIPAASSDAQSRSPAPTP
jgi:hypothetical protein